MGQAALFTYFAHSLSSMLRRRGQVKKAGRKVACPLFLFGALFFKHLKCIGPAIVGDDDARVFHGPLPRLG